jgi:hypothetical protein
MHAQPLENDVRLFIYEHFVAECRAPTMLETAQPFGLDPDQIREVLDALAEKHVLVLHPGSHEIWMAMPFSAIPTAFRVIRGGSVWWAN